MPKDFSHSNRAAIHREMHTRFALGRGIATLLLLALGAVAAAAEPVGSGSSPGKLKEFGLDLLTQVPQEAGGEFGHLTRELIRQSALLAAREELGLPTRDAVLGESLPGQADSAPPALNLVDWKVEKGRVSVTLTLADRPGVERTVIESDDVSAGEWLEGLATKFESLSATKIVEALKQFGFKGQSRAFLSAGAVPDAIQKDLAKFDMLSQFAGVRALHAEIAKSGESPERLSALSRGYANLGALTEHLWHPAWRVFSARSLLYAERLLRKHSAKRFGLWNRAYVRGLAGLHRTALADLQAAAAAPVEGDVPQWVAAIDAYCRSDARGLSAMIERSEGSALPQYLRLLTMNASSNSQLRLEAVQEMLAVEPACMQAYDVSLYKAQLDVYGTACSTAFREFSESIRTRLFDQKELPESVRNAISKPAAGQAAELEARANLVHNLREAGRIGLDSGEPSLAVLATLIREQSFVHAWRELDLEVYMYGIDSDKTLAAVKPIVSGHPFEPFLEAHVNDRFARLNRLKLVLPIVRDIPVEPAAWGPIMNRAERNEETCDRLARQSDRIVPDLVRNLRNGTSMKLKAQLSAALREVSPDSAIAVAASITNDWEQVKEFANDWEKKFNHEPDVINALANRYAVLKQLDDAERCLKRLIELAPDRASHQALARHYWSRGDENGWVEMMTASLEYAAFGLEAHQTRATLARYFMKRKEWERARPHVEFAIGSYASWALTCGADFYELTEDWDRAEELHQANSERYFDGAAIWYKWCRRTGRGDVAAARIPMQKLLESRRNAKSLRAREYASTLLVLEGEPEQALETLQGGMEFGKWPYNQIMAALWTDELRRTELRDDLLRQAANPVDFRYSEFRHWLRRFLAAPHAPFDRKLLDWTIHDGSSEEHVATAKMHFAGSFLLLHDHPTEGLDYLRQAATSSSYASDDAIMAAHALRQRGEKIGTPRDTEYDAESAKRYKLLDAALAHSVSNRWEETIAKCSEIIEQAPSFPEVYELRSQGRLNLEQQELALADIDRAIELLPGSARFLVRRAAIRQRLGNHQGAIEDYRGALGIYPDYSLAHNELAFLYGACLDPKFRDARQSEHHAQKSAELGEMPEHIIAAALAIAAAERGDFPRAVELQKQAVSKSPDDARSLFSERLRLFERGQPYHRQPEWWKRGSQPKRKE